MVMGRNGYGPKWSWAEMVMGRNDPESYSDVPHENRLILGTPKNKNKTKVQYESHNRSVPAAPDLPRQNQNSLLVKRHNDNTSPEFNVYKLK